jgi:hypothetical protein
MYENPAKGVVPLFLFYFNLSNLGIRPFDLSLRFSANSAVYLIRTQKRKGAKKKSNGSWHTEPSQRVTRQKAVTGV